MALEWPDVVETVNDRHQLKNQITQANAVLGKPCQTVCADAGYDNNSDWKDLEEQGIAVVVKPNGQEPPGPFTKDKFQYDVKRDCYVCPMGHVLRYCSTHSNHHRQYVITDVKLCRGCPHFGVCTKAWGGRTIVWMPLEEIPPIVQARAMHPPRAKPFMRGSNPRWNVPLATSNTIWACKVFYFASSQEFARKPRCSQLASTSRAS